MGDETIRANLRLLGAVGKNQYISTSADGNILSIEDNTFYNNVISILRGDFWSDTRKCLEKIIVNDTPDLTSKLLCNKKNVEILNLRKLLKGSITGLSNMKNMWVSCPLQLALIDTYISDYIEISIYRAELYLDEEKITYVN